MFHLIDLFSPVCVKNILLKTSSLSLTNTNESPSWQVAIEASKLQLFDTTNPCVSQWSAIQSLRGPHWGDSVWFQAYSRDRWFRLGSKKVSFLYLKNFSLISYFTPTQWSWWGIYWIHLVRPSLCKWHGFWSIALSLFRNFKFHLHISSATAWKPIHFED